jgi:hypothetical protein
MLSLPLSVVGAFGGAVPDRDDPQHLLDDRLHHADGSGDQERQSCWSTSPITCGHEGRTTLDACSRRGRSVLRPILMTTFAMIFGMLPVALASAKAARPGAPMAVAVMGGLTNLDALTLVGGAGGLHLRRSLLDQRCRTAG